MVVRQVTVADAARGGSRRDLLVAMRDRIARTVSDEGCPPRDLASLTKRLGDIARELEALDDDAKRETGAEVADVKFVPQAV